jgi:hypothetical protein
VEFKRTRVLWNRVLDPDVIVRSATGLACYLPMARNVFCLHSDVKFI